jgi:hypothetical protein
LAAASPKVIYKPDPARPADVASVELKTSRNPCFGVVRASVLLSSRKSDGGRAWALSATVADSSAPAQIEGASFGGAPLKLVTVRNGDVACTDYQCPTGSSAVFELDAARREALASAGTMALEVRTTAGDRCGLSTPVDRAVIDALAAWADRLAKPAG